MAKELKEAFGTESKLTAGSNGIFDVIVDGKKIFSRGETGRFPNPGEIVTAIKD